MPRTLSSHEHARIIHRRVKIDGRDAGRCIAAIGDKVRILRRDGTSFWIASVLAVPIEDPATD